VSQAPQCALAVMTPAIKRRGISRNFFIYILLVDI
ncbi:MAG: hypothetical protein ACI8Z5_001816, partial [Lentimonas sp.]